MEASERYVPLDRSLKRKCVEVEVAMNEKAAALLQRYALGERSFRGLELDDLTYDFRNAKLADADFTGSFIVADFRGADLRNADFANANIKTCDFRGADLSGSNFKGAALDAAKFEGARMSNTKFAGAFIQGQELNEHERP
jgi:uncharacterized protein YjbI with pentapeptide repeats